MHFGVVAAGVGGVVGLSHFDGGGSFVEDVVDFVD